MTDHQMIVRLAAAAILGGLVGLERQVRGQAAGLRTHILVSIGSALVTVTNIHVFEQYAGKASMDPTRMSAQVISGIGFLGAGAIMRYGVSIRGLTTAASLWAIGAVGIAAGFGCLFEAAAATLMVLLSLAILRWVDSHLPKIEHSRAHVDAAAEAGCPYRGPGRTGHADEERQKP